MMSNFDGERESDVYANTPLLQQLDALYLRYDPQWAELQRLAHQWVAWVCLHDVARGYVRRPALTGELTRG